MDAVLLYCAYMAGALLISVVSLALLFALGYIGADRANDRRDDDGVVRDERP